MNGPLLHERGRRAGGTRTFGTGWPTSDSRPLDMLLRIGALLGADAWCALLLAPFVTIIAWG